MAGNYKGLELSTEELQSYIPKYVWLREQIRELITKLPVGAALPTMATIQQDYQVSRQTVDRAVQELRSEGWLQSRRGSGIYVTPLAKMVKVGVVCSFDIFTGTEHQFFMQLWQHLQQLAEARHMQIRYYFLDFSPGSPKRHPQLEYDIAARETNGLVSIGTISKDLAIYNIPCFTLGKYQDNHSVMPDYTSFIEQAVESLVAQGCRRLAFIAHTGFGDDEAGIFTRAIAHAGVQSREEWMKWLPGTGHSLQLSGQQIFHELWGCAEKPDGIISIDDNATVGMLEAARTLGVAIPDAVRIATHANRGVALFGDAQITRVEFDTEEIADILLTALSNAVRGLSTSAEGYLVQPHLVLPDGA